MNKLNILLILCLLYSSTPLKLNNLKSMSNADPTVTTKGSIKNATNNQSVPNSKNIKVSFTSSSGVLFPATVKDGSTYEINLTPGTYTRIASADGFAENRTNVTINESTDKSKPENTILLSSAINGWRVVLTWTKQVKDLDAVLILPDEMSINYSNKKNPEGNITLDLDARNGAGPETMSLVNPATRVYKFFVIRYTKENTITNSGAKVTLYRGNQQVAEVLASSVQSDDKNVWNVFEIDAGSGTFKVLNTFYG
jgi:adhesin/invasin